MAMKAWEGLHLQRRPASSDHALPCRRSGPPHSPQTARRSIRGGQRGLVRAATHNAAAGARAGWSAKRRQRCPGRSGTMPQAVTALQPRGLRWASVGGCCGSAPSRAPPDAPFVHGIAYQLLHASMFYGDECAISMVPGRGVLCASLHAGAGQTGRRALPSQPSAPKLHHCQALPLLA